MPNISPSLRIVVLDDNQAIADSLALILRCYQHEVRSVYDPIDALRMLRSFNPHAIIADVILPGMSGIEFAARAAEICPCAKILLISGYDKGISDGKPIEWVGPEFTILQKPVHPKEILAFISTCVPRTETSSA